MNSTTIAAAPLMSMLHSSIEVVNDNFSVHTHPCNYNDPDKTTLMEMMNSAAGNPCNACNAKRNGMVTVFLSHAFKTR